MFDLQRIKERSKLLRPIFVPLILYIGLLVFSSNWVEGNPDGPNNFWIALSPMLPGIFFGLGVVKAISRLDELERKIRLEGMAFSFMITLLLVVSFGLVEPLGFPRINSAYIAGVMVVLWLIGKLWAMRKYHEE
ncbi:MAG: hypothetical protein HON98_01390 [Chloroflexi bacterium]|jgi:hypothetical protein|nr:hypothetical protein [Chloroflexota bacterium]MBT3668812.1 hypothetical protein [Chloroflexota bacterium]MBT4003807.1 hypothetical protein [Chloroflexota bacterium]MBT4306526.1 hypothetical protein [Chloroflexota bacterium]MBT4533910.1 hypothetical protein [Chloroflexota bacterium]